MEKTAICCAITARNDYLCAYNMKKTAIMDWQKILAIFGLPIRRNSRIFVMMYLLGLVCIMTTNDSGKHIAVFELFFDLYVLCAVLAALPPTARKIAATVVEVLFYVLAAVDIFCWWRIGTPICAELLQDVIQTTGREAAEALGSYVGWNVLVSPVMMVAGVAVLDVWTALRHQRWRLPRLRDEWIGAVCLVAVVLTAVATAKNKRFIYYNLVKARTSLDLQYFREMPYGAGFYLPVYRLADAVKTVSVNSNEIEALTKGLGKARAVMTDDNRPDIVLIIGEAFSKHHSQLYGYRLPTTPWQASQEADSSLVAFSDVVAPFHQTSEVFRMLFSLYTYADRGQWSDYPLFTELFRRAGWQVTFITNQFAGSSLFNVWDFSGSSFLNQRELSEAQFSHRNRRTHEYDEGLLQDYDSLRHYEGRHNLTIFHLLGQHIGYGARYPKAEAAFGHKDYRRPELSADDLRELADYDNATRYNDKVVKEIVGRFANRDAVVIYLPDHGEMVFDGGNRFGRTLEVKTRNEVWQQFPISFWIWMSDKCRRNHPDIYRRAVAAKNRPYMTDRLPHLLLALGGIRTPWYREDYDLLSPGYDSRQRRMIMGKMDYDKAVGQR